MKRFNRVHFVGIGGAGMCGIAEVLHNLGYEVSGSDLGSGSSVERLIRLGVTVFDTHDAANVSGAQVVVASTAIPADNPELLTARENRIPVVPRAEMLGELMRFRDGIAVAGTHGKTTTTSLIASVLAAGGLDPTYVIGGLLNASGTNAALGSSQYLVAEADESDGSFLLLQPTVAVVTNIDRDHMETYEGDMARLADAFEQFVHHVPFYGLAVLCIDNPLIAEMVEGLPRNFVTYAVDRDADYRAVKVFAHGLQTRFDVTHEELEKPLPMILNMPGAHNVRNALAAIAVARDLGVEWSVIGDALESFEGVGRRFQVCGETTLGEANVTIMHDYAHHPTEIEVTLEAAAGVWPTQRRIVVFQPHRYTRTRDHLEDFARVLSRCDHLLITEVYPAGESRIPKAGSRALCRAIRARGRTEPIFIESIANVAETLGPLVRDGDVIMFLGAGTVGQAAVSLHKNAEVVE